MTKREIVAGLIDLSRKLERSHRNMESVALIRIADKVSKENIKENDLEESRRGNPKDPQNKQLEKIQGKSPEEPSEVRLESKRGKKQS